MFNIGRMLEVGAVRIGALDGPDPDRGPPFERRGCKGNNYDELPEKQKAVLYAYILWLFYSSTVKFHFTSKFSQLSFKQLHNL